MVDRVEQPHDVAVHLDGVRDGNLAFEQSPEALSDDRLAVSRRAVDEERVTRGGGGSHLVQHPVAEHQVRERLDDPLARRDRRHRVAVGLQVALILGQRHRGHARVVALFEEELRAPATLVRDPIPVRRGSDDGRSDDLDLVRQPKRLERRLDDRELEPEALGQVGADQIAQLIQLLQHQLRQEVVAEAGFGRGSRAPADARPAVTSATFLAGGSIVDIGVIESLHRAAPDMRRALPGSRAARRPAIRAALRGRVRTTGPPANTARWRPAPCPD